MPKAAAAAVLLPSQALRAALGLVHGGLETAVGEGLGCRELGGIGGQQFGGDPP